MTTKLKGRLATISFPASDVSRVRYCRGSAYDELQFGTDSLCVERNSVLFIPQLLSPSGAEGGGSLFPFQEGACQSLAGVVGKPDIIKMSG